MHFTDTNCAYGVLARSSLNTTLYEENRTCCFNPCRRVVIIYGYFNESRRGFAQICLIRSWLLHCAMALLRQLLRGREDEDSEEEDERLLQAGSDASSQSEDDAENENAQGSTVTSILCSY